MTKLTNYQKCRKYMNRSVSIKTVHGGTFIGKIVKVDKDRVYLKPLSPRKNSKKAYTSFFFIPIIPLVLFDLLVITLLDNRRRIPFC